MRETYTRYGRDNLGFALFGEFLISALPVIVMWHFPRGRYEHGLLVMPFAWSGYPRSAIPPCRRPGAARDPAQHGLALARLPK
jgi:hypothetical protein